MFRLFLMVAWLFASLSLAMPPVPTQYWYPSLVCGKQLPVPSPTAQTTLSGLYSQCIANGCNQPGSYSGDSVKAIAEAVFPESRAFIFQAENVTNAYTLFCAFFGSQVLDYVNCGYKLSAQINYQGDACSTSTEDTAPTSIFGPNKASFTLEQRNAPGGTIASVVDEYRARGQAYLDQINIERLKFNGKGWFVGMIQGFEKARMLKQLNCDSATASQSQTTTVSSSGSETFSALVLHKPRPRTDTQTTTASLSVSLSAESTMTESPSASESHSETITSSKTKTATIPIAGWLASSGFYADTANQPGRYNVLNSVVTDTLTGMQWEQAASPRTMTQAAAASYCTNKATGGLSGWRLPTAAELQTLFDYTIPYQGTVPGINTVAFPSTPTTLFWSSTPIVGVSGQHWYASFGVSACYAGLIYGIVSGWTNCGSDSGYARCVRSNFVPPTMGRYIVSAGIVTDTMTGLVWQQKATGGNMNWASASTHCTGLSLGSKSWRLPNVRELSTLIDYKVTQNSLMMDAVAFVGEPVTWYWSSTAVAGAPDFRLERLLR